MALVARSNGLQELDDSPWHLKVRFQLFDDAAYGSVAGTYEEYWAGPTRYKRTFFTSKFAQTDYGTDKGVLRAGMQQQLPDIILDIRREIVDPAPNAVAIAHLDFAPSQRSFNGLKLRCLAITGMPLHAGRSWCVRGDSPILRATTSSGEDLQMVREHAIQFRDRSVPGDLQFLRAGKTLLVAHVDLIAPLSPTDAAELNPSTDAAPLRRRISISGSVAAGLLVQQIQPSYPTGGHVSGTVTLRAVIAPDGHVEDLNVVSGPPLLRQPALDAVRQWVYQPYLVNNEPVEVMTTIDVFFGH